MLKSENRLRKSRDVSFVYSKGRGVFSPYFVLKYRFSKGVNTRITVVVSTKVSKKSNVRNRIKRIIRELVRKNLAYFKPVDMIITVKPVSLKISERELLSNLQALLQKSPVWVK